MGGGKEVCGMGGMACGSTMFIHDVVQIDCNKQHIFFMVWHSCLTTTRWHCDLADDVSLFSSYFSFLHLHRSYSPQAHLQSCHCIVAVYILTHNVLPASPGRAHKSKQSTTTSIHAHCHNFSSSSSLSYSHLHNYTLIHTRIQSQSQRIGWLVGYLVFMSQRLEPIRDCPVESLV